MEVLYEPTIHTVTLYDILTTCLAYIRMSDSIMAREIGFTDGTDNIAYWCVRTAYGTVFHFVYAHTYYLF